MSELKSELIRLTSSMLMGRNIGKLQVISEYQQTIKGSKLNRMLEDVQEGMRVDAIFLKKVIDYITKLEKGE